MAPRTTKNEKKAIEESMKNLKLDAPSKGGGEGIMVGPREGSPSDETSYVSSVGATAGSFKGSEVDRQAFVGDQGVYCYGYCYPGFNSAYGEWDVQGCFVPANDIEIQPSDAQADYGPLLYYLPSYQPEYLSYNSITPGAVVGVNGQYLGQSSYHSSPMIQQPLGSPWFVPQSVAYGSELLSAYPWDSSLLFANGFQVHGFYGDAVVPAPKSCFAQSQIPQSSKISTSSLGLDAKPTPVVPKQAFKPLTKGTPALYAKSYIPINKIPAYTNQGKGGKLYPNSPINDRNWVGVEKVKARTILQVPGDFDLSEQNRGPRTNSNKSSLVSDVNLVGSPNNGKNDINNTIIATVRKDMYNLSSFRTEYEHALFFVIKSYSEDDVHKGIKYNVWASTPSGNRRLDNAFQLAQEKMIEKGSSCPVFLFFSVNASHQFCGVAEMLNPVDFSKSMDFWQQDKWNGFFPVKWHIIKDVPNPLFRHILLENNENKPVTNSRDTQEVKFHQGIKMLNIFKNYTSKTSILDDFDFYESRQKIMQHKRSKPLSMLNFGDPSPKMEELAQIAKPNDIKSVEVEAEAGKVKG